MPSHKRVIVRKLNQEWLPGYLPPESFVEHGQIELLGLEGKITTLPLTVIQWICFVRDFLPAEPQFPERLLVRSFSRRSSLPGLVLRVRLSNDDWIEGLTQNNLTLLDPEGIFLIPADGRSNTQRMFLPRAAVAEMEVTAVLRGLHARKNRKVGQTALFGSAVEDKSL